MRSNGARVETGGRGRQGLGVGRILGSESGGGGGGGGWITPDGSSGGKSVVEFGGGDLLK